MNQLRSAFTSAIWSDSVLDTEEPPKNPVIGKAFNAAIYFQQRRAQWVFRGVCVTVVSGWFSVLQPKRSLIHFYRVPAACFPETRGPWVPELPTWFQACSVLYTSAIWNIQLMRSICLLWRESFCHLGHFYLRKSIWTMPLFRSFRGLLGINSDIFEQGQTTQKDKLCTCTKEKASFTLITLTCL